MATIFKLINGSYSPPVDSTQKLIRDASVEFVATTLFVFSGTLSAVSTGKQWVRADSVGDVARILPIAMCFGIAILALAHSIGHLTGGHMNPGVSLLMFLRGQITATKMLAYWVAQFSAALLASALVWGCTSGLTNEIDEVESPPFLLGSTTKAPGITVGNAFLIEVMGAIVFYFVIAQTALDKRGIATTAFPAIPIGLVLVVVHVCLIPFTGCGVNPARSFGPAMVTCMASKSQCADAAGSAWYWIYFVGPAVAAFITAEVTNLISTPLEEEEKAAAVQEMKEQPVELVSADEHVA